MSEPAKNRPLAVVIAAAAFYSLVGVLFAAPTSHARAWRLAAWAVSATAFAAHVAYERFGLRSSPRAGALRVGLGSAFGALGLAAAANIHSMSVSSTDQHRRLLQLALVIWPVMTFLPAMAAAFAASWVLARLAGGGVSRARPGVPPSSPE